MSDAKYTSGPWCVDGHLRWEYPRVTDTRGRFVADCASDEYARLIAAAPELLKSLQELLEACEGVHRSASGQRVLDAAAVAIAKAIGAQS